MTINGIQMIRLHRRNLSARYRAERRRKALERLAQRMLNVVGISAATFGAVVVVAMIARAIGSALGGTP